MIKAVMFDFDDTLHDYGVALSYYLDWFSAKYFDKEPEGFRMDFVENIARGYKAKLPFFQYIGDKYPQLKSYDADEVLRDFAPMIARSVHIFPCVPDVIKAVSAQGLKVVLVTNGPSFMQNYKVNLSGLRRLFDDVLVSEDVIVRKPDKGIFQLAARRQDVTCDQCFFVGDHPLIDIAGSQGAGMHPIYCRFRREPEIPGIPSIDDISKLPEAVARLSAQYK